MSAMLFFTGCNKKDDSGGGSGKSVPDPEGTIIVAMRNASNEDTWIYPFPDIHYQSIVPYLHITSSDNFEGFDMQFTTVGKVNGLGNIISIPESGWATRVAVMPGYGYVGRYSNPNVDYLYVRIYVVDYILAAVNNGVIGATVKYQTPFEPGN